MALTDTEIEMCRHYLGYNNLTSAANPWVDTVLVFEDVVQQNVRPWTEEQVRSVVLPNLQVLDQEIMDARANFAATELVGEVKLNDKQMDKLLDLRDFWIDELSKMLGVSVRYPQGGSNGIELT